MKTVVVPALLLALVAGVGASGSMAQQPLKATSVAFAQCSHAGVARSDACQPLSRPRLAQTEGELTAADRYGEVDARAVAAMGEDVGESRALAWGFLYEVARYLVDLYRYFTVGGFRRRIPIVAETVFDPVNQK